MNLLHTIARKHRENLLHISEDIIFRWSPRVMSGEAVSEAELKPLFEAARWAPSGRNSQEWRFYYALRGEPAFDELYCLLSENNQRWCAQAGALLVLASLKYYEGGQHFIRSHSLDTGMAFQNFAIEGTRRDLVVHPLGGFDRHKAEEFMRLGETYELEMMIAVGKPGDPAVVEADRQPTPRQVVEAFVQRL